MLPGLPFIALPFSLGPAELAAHLHIMGLTGMGKSKLLAQFASELILQGRSCAVLDPHADLVDDILLALLRRGYFRRPDAPRRVLYVDFANALRFVPFNVLRQPYPSYEIARNLVEACTRAWPSLSGGAAPQFENLLLAAATVLVANHLPLTALSALLTDEAYRHQLLTQIDDPQILDFFHNRYDRSPGRGGSQLNESTLRRAFLLTYPPPLRYSLGQRENLLDFRALMDRGTSLLISLGGLDPQTQRLLGCLITVGFEQAALSRADLPLQERRPYHLIVDEFSQFSAQSEEALERALALTRKYGLFLVLAHQTWGQAKGLQSALQNAAFLTFRPGVDDLAYAAARVGPTNPYRVKYVTKTHTVQMSATEQRAEWEYGLARLRPREAFLRMRGRTVAFTTATLPRPTPTLLHDLRTLQSTYAQTLLVPREQIPQVAGGRGEVDAGHPAPTPPLSSLADVADAPDSPPIAPLLSHRVEGSQHVPGTVARKTALSAATSATGRG